MSFFSSSLYFGWTLNDWMVRRSGSQPWSSRSHRRRSHAPMMTQSTRYIRLSTQCAAVRTTSGAMSEPPHQPGKLTIQGLSLGACGLVLVAGRTRWARGGSSRRGRGGPVDGGFGARIFRMVAKMLGNLSFGIVDRLGVV